MNSNGFIVYATPQKQLEKLKSRDLIVQDDAAALSALALYGYSNVIKSYRDPYVYVSENGDKYYRSGVTFDQVASLYLLDKNLRNSVMAAMLAIEECIKEAAADVVADSFGVSSNNYLSFRNFQNRRKKPDRFSLSSILKKMNNELHSEKDPVHYYMTKYGDVPPWILFKNVYFSTIVNYIDQFKATERNMFIKHIYDPVFLSKSGDVSSLMRHTLFMCLAYRNTAAHGGRIYNLDYQQNNFPLGQNNLHGFNKLLTLLSVLKYKQPFYQLQNSLNVELTRHCSSFPEDVTYLGVTLNMNIETSQRVYISQKSRIYHTDPRCSGIKNATETDLSTAISDGYAACKKCVHV